MNNNSIGKNIKNYRLLKGWTQEQLANESGLSKNAIYNYENDKRIPNINILNNIANALEVNYDDIIDSGNITRIEDEMKRKLSTSNGSDLWRNYIPYAKKLLSDGSNDIDLYYYLGFSYFALEKYEKAIEWYEKTIEIDNQEIRAYIGLGNVFLCTHKYTKAIEYYLKALKIDKECIEAYLQLGDAFCNINKYKKALKCYTKAIELDDECIEAYMKKDHIFNSVLEYSQLVDKYDILDVELETSCDSEKQSKHSSLLRKIYFEAQKLDIEELKTFSSMMSMFNEKKDTKSK
ncbi:tetratricopeptide repeat protein [Clostridioides sp. ES-S-0005-03]|uniref:tetratricopeptide repeat protein n=1 Tax=Clostridioides sp. ES-S-0005-03 TaxID=2770774 RepID=UPI001D111378|nr:tetratricopeptide repeat protein [Clostridioides sp. ES-S-0005-03]